MLRLLVRRSNDVTYFTNDEANEIAGPRHGPAGWWLRGEGDTTSPRDVSAVLQTTDRSSVHGYDLIVAAPRPISILLAVDPRHADGVVDAHRSSVRASLDYLEQHALVVRERRDGLDRDEAGRWRSVVSFTHGVNRHGEPHLHDHVLVGARPEGSRTVLDSRGLYAHLRAADAVYRASLRYELAERTPWAAWRSFEGIEHVVGLDEGYRALWSGHHAERGDKLHWERRDAVASWNDDLQRFDHHGVKDPPQLHRNVLDEHVFASALEGRHDVGRRHVVEAWANAATFGQDAHALSKGVSSLFPSLEGSRGVRESTIPVREARMTALVRTHGPRPIAERELEQWRQRSREPSREPSRDRSDRSR